MNPENDGPEENKVGQRPFIDRHLVTLREWRDTGQPPYTDIGTGIFLAQIVQDIEYLLRVESKLLRDLDEVQRTCATLEATGIALRAEQQMRGSA